MRVAGNQATVKNQAAEKYCR